MRLPSKRWASLLARPWHLRTPPSGIGSSVAAGVPTVGVASTHDLTGRKELSVNLGVCDFADPKLMAFIEER